MDAAGTGEVTDGHLLGGRVRYAQPRQGFRSGIEPVLLAAAVPLRPGERLLEGGTGAGAALLCAAHRVPGIMGVGVEREPDLVRLAYANVHANGFAGLMPIVADVDALPLAGPFDHACANPPYYPQGGTRSPYPGRESAKRAGPDLLLRWARALARPLRHRGTLTFVLPAVLMEAALGAMTAAGCAVESIFPLWPKADRAAGLMLVQGVKDGRNATRLLPGLVVHEPDGRFTAAADAILRDGAALPLR
ncbi:MAG: tRNA1(Val) (adenine(37)-N6)-methyltransferase [Acetobacteraceae bacterium]